jgi:hypothetical protein
MSDKDTGGSAFPRTAFDQNGELTTWDAEFKGMTLRDYFAAKAITTLVNFTNDKTYEYEAAATAYRYADAMLEARKS